MKRRILLVADVPGWAFDQNMRDMIEYLGDDFEFTMNYVVSNALPQRWDYDAVYLCFHHWYKRFFTRPMLSSCRSRWLWTNMRLNTAPDDFNFVNDKFIKFHFVEKNSFEEFKPHCKRISYLTNPVNMRRFPFASKMKDEIICEWNGNAQHMSAPERDVKGFYSTVLPSIALAKVKFDYAEYNTRKLPPKVMPQFYQQCNVALSASLFEGASNSVMEAMASGLAVICTDVGNHREMHESMLRNFGDSGMLLVDRNANTFAQAISSLTPERAYEMGQINRSEIAERWSWDAWRDRYKEFLTI